MCVLCAPKCALNVRIFPRPCARACLSGYRLRAVCVYMCIFVVKPEECRNEQVMSISALRFLWPERARSMSEWMCCAAYSPPAPLRFRFMISLYSLLSEHVSFFGWSRFPGALCGAIRAKRTVKWCHFESSSTCMKCSVCACDCERGLAATLDPELERRQFNM